MGGKLGTIFAHAGHEVVFSYARDGEKLKRLAQDAGGKATSGAVREAAQGARVLSTSLPLRILEVLRDNTIALFRKVSLATRPT
jgi:predicted dinucleotide-binding enzyme